MALSRHQRKIRTKAWIKNEKGIGILGHIFLDTAAMSAVVDFLKFGIFVMMIPWIAGWDKYALRPRWSVQ